MEPRQLFDSLGNCSDGARNGDEICADCGGRCSAPAHAQAFSLQNMTTCGKGRNASAAALNSKSKHPSVKPYAEGEGCYYGFAKLLGAFRSQIAVQYNQHQRVFALRLEGSVGGDRGIAGIMSRPWSKQNTKHETHSRE